MKSRNQKDPKDNVANLSKRARLDVLLFNGARLGTPLSALVGPKLPPYSGE
jgi:hypothetical protein